MGKWIFIPTVVRDPTDRIASGFPGFSPIIQTALGKWIFILTVVRDPKDRIGLKPHEAKNLSIEWAKATFQFKNREQG
ncbi:hypothetical protein DDT91_14840 [Algoriphagus sp. AK58]|nr:hypothetical protein [Algoriphagus sp. AK58]